ncbi:MAG: 4Fe-4S binding protein [Ignavibacteria bacterium]|nr:4Fe-4S binding protein [Ignavibacteria bacterium]
MLKKIRLVLAILFIFLLTFFFLDYAGVLPNGLHTLAHFQFVPSVMMAMSLEFTTLVILVVLTALLGRIYCSVICPLGVYQDFVYWVSKKVHKKKHSAYSKPITWLRYVVLAIAFIAFITNFTLIVGLLDPYAAYGRIATDLFRPVYLFANNLLADYFESTGDYYILPVEIGIISVFSLVVAVITILLVTVLSFANGRTYCNTICPVGTLLGLLSKVSLFKVRIDESKCNKCGLCAMSCKASCINSKDCAIDYSRCVDCFDCLQKCKRDALHFQREVKKTAIGSIASDERREFITTSIALTTGVIASVALPRTLLADNNSKTNNTKADDIDSKIAIAPPGAISHQHLISRCTSCHLCIDRCPQSVLKPAKMEYGISGIMMPVMDYMNGFCNYHCNVCASVCPNGALNTPNAAHNKERIQVGIAKYRKELCQVNTMNISCGICATNCPTNAITMLPNPSNPKYKIPLVDESKCIGCGACEYYCPTTKNKAISVQGSKVHKLVDN